MSRFNIFSPRRNRDRQLSRPPVYTPDLTPPPSYASATSAGPEGSTLPDQMQSTRIWSATANQASAQDSIADIKDGGTIQKKSVDLPFDILLRLAHFIPDTELKNMLTVGPFFEIAMDARYRHVSFYDLGNPKVMRRLERLRDPTVGTRVRSLHVRLSLNPLFVRLWREKQEKEKLRWDTPEEEAMFFATELVSNLSNVVELTIGYWEPNVENYLSSAFFTVAWDTFGSTLKVLSLEGGINPSKILPLRRLPALREIQICIRGSNVTTQTIDDTATYINDCGATIHNLSVTSWGSWDLSPFCGQLGPLHFLERLRIIMPFNEILSLPGGLTHLLSCHALTLRHVYLRLDSASEEGEGKLGRWMSANAHRQSLLKNLKTLEVSLSPLADISTLLSFVSRSVETLTKLVVMHRFCTYEEVATITHSFAHRRGDSGLRTLGLNVRFFEPRLLDLLSEHLPDLYELNVNAFNWGAEGWEADETEDAFREEMTKRFYRNWHLFDIGVWLRLGYDEMVMKKVDYEDMLLLAESMPSVQKFWGKYIPSGNPHEKPG